MFLLLLLLYTELTWPFRSWGRPPWPPCRPMSKKSKLCCCCKSKSNQNWPTKQLCLTLHCLHFSITRLALVGIWVLNPCDPIGYSSLCRRERKRTVIFNRSGERWGCQNRTLALCLSLPSWDRIVISKAKLPHSRTPGLLQSWTKRRM